MDIDEYISLAAQSYLTKLEEEEIQRKQREEEKAKRFAYLQSQIIEKIASHITAKLQPYLVVSFHKDTAHIKEAYFELPQCLPIVIDFEDAVKYKPLQFVVDKKRDTSQFFSDLFFAIGYARIEYNKAQETKRKTNDQ